MNRTAQEAGKVRSQRSSNLLREYLKGLDREHADLAAQRDYLQAWIELLERQRANLQEAIEIEKKLAEMTRSSPSALEIPSGSPKREAVLAP